jgi:hypothetical protein
VCHAVGAPGWKVTLTAAARAGGFGWSSGSSRAGPVNQSAFPSFVSLDPAFVISIVRTFRSTQTLPANRTRFTRKIRAGIRSLNSGAFRRNN